MQSNHRGTASLIACLTIVLISALAAQQPAPQADFDAQHRQAVEKNPPGISFTLRLKNNKTTFRRGEIIPVEFEFSTSRPQDYVLDTELAGDSGTGRTLDAFHFTPRDGVNHVQGGTIMARTWSGSNPQAVEEGKAYVLELDLNDWWQFARPGKYRIYATSARFWPRLPPGTPSQDNPLRVTSNIVEIEIVPAEKAWAEQQVREAARILDTASQDNPPRMIPNVIESRTVPMENPWAQQQQVRDTENKARRRVAYRTLRFLDTESAVREMVRRLDGRDHEGDNQIPTALMKSRHRALVVREMEKQLKVPEHPVTAAFMSILASMASQLKHPTPKWPSPTNAIQKARLEKEQQKHRKQFHAFRLRYLENLIALLPHKRGRARAVTSNALLYLLHSRWNWLDNVPDGTRRSPQVIEWRKKIWPDIMAVFNDLPSNDQHILVQEYWKPLVATGNHVAILSTLKRIYKNLLGTTDFRSGWSPRTIVLSRIYELAPHEGRELIFDEIRSLHPHVGVEVLGLLPDQPIPELDEPIIKMLESSQHWEIANFLVERYASPAVKARVQAKLDRSTPCYKEVLAYFMRVDPALGVELMNKALNEKVHTGLCRNLVSDVAALEMTPELEKIAIERLDNPDVKIATDALWALRDHGSPAGEAALWRRLEKWHEECKGREAELELQANGFGGNSQAQLGSTLTYALATSPQWVADKADLMKLQELAVTPQTRRTVESWLRQWNALVTIRLAGGTDSEWRTARSANTIPASRLDSYGVVQYSVSSFNQGGALPKFKAKLSQFPHGTVFVLPADILKDPAERSTLFRDLQAYLTEHGMTLVQGPTKLAASIKERNGNFARTHRHHQRRRR